MLGIKHRHILDFTVPTKVQGGLHNPNPLPGRSHLSLSSGHETGRWGLCRRGTEQGLQWDRAVVIICARASFPAETRLSWTASLVTHCSLWPEQKRQLNARRKNRRTGKSSDSPGDRQEGGEGLCGLSKVTVPHGVSSDVSPAQELFLQGPGAGRERCPKDIPTGTRGD